MHGKPAFGIRPHLFAVQGDFPVRRSTPGNPHFDEHLLDINGTTQSHARHPGTAHRRGHARFLLGAGRLDPLVLPWFPFRTGIGRPVFCSGGACLFRRAFLLTMLLHEWKNLFRAAPGVFRRQPQNLRRQPGVLIDSSVFAGRLLWFRRAFLLHHRRQNPRLRGNHPGRFPGFNLDIRGHRRGACRRSVNSIRGGQPNEPAGRIRQSDIRHERTGRFFQIDIPVVGQSLDGHIRIGYLSGAAQFRSCHIVQPHRHNRFFTNRFRRNTLPRQVVVIPANRPAGMNLVRVDFGKKHLCFLRFRRKIAVGNMPADRKQFFAGMRHTAVLRWHRALFGTFGLPRKESPSPFSTISPGF